MSWRVTVTCSNCGGSKFGLIRYNHFRRTFCRKVCKDEFYAKQQRQVDQQRRFLAYLAKPG